MIGAVFRLCEVEKRAIEANLAHLMSPEVALTNVWFLGRFGVTYLFPNETHYSEVCIIMFFSDFYETLVIILCNMFH